MKETMRNYAFTRASIEHAESSLKELLDQVKQTEEYQSIENFLVIKKQELAELEEIIRMATIDAFKLTGKKQPWEGVGIRETTKYLYDERLSTKWASENAPQTLTIDKKKFEKTISAFDPGDLPDFITVYKEPTATISKDLEIYLLPEPEELPSEVQE